MNLIPTVVEQTKRGERVDNISSRLLRDYIGLLGAVAADNVADLITAQFLFLESEDLEKGIYFCVTSLGRSVTAGLAFCDTMRHVHPDTFTFFCGQAASMAAWLLPAGAKGRRYALFYARFVLHQPHPKKLSVILTVTFSSLANRRWKTTA